MEAGVRPSAAGIFQLLLRPMPGNNWPLGMIVPIQDETPFSPFAPADWRTALGEVKAAGYDGVELAITDPTRLSPTEIKEALAQEGLHFFSITTGQAAAKEGLSLSSPNDGVRRRAIARIQAHMRLAREFDAVVIIGSLRGADGSIDLLVESLRECAGYQPEVKLALEPLNRYESRLINTVEQARAVIEKVGADNLGILFDTFHANIEEVSISKAIRTAGDRLFHVHLADSNRFVPGYGHLDFGEVWRALAEIGYRGALVLEPLPKPNPEALLAAAARLKGETE